MEKEILKYKNNISRSVDETSRLVEGYALIFESPSEDLGFIETIHRGAVTDETIKNSDVFCRFNHQDDKILARSRYGEGSLLLEVDEKGLKYMFEAPKTQLGDELLEYLKRGDLNQSSFAFTISKENGAEKWRNIGGVLYRDIYKIDKLYDVAPVWTPAYSATECSKRGKEMIQTNDEINKKLDEQLKLLDDIFNL